MKFKTFLVRLISMILCIYLSGVLYAQTEVNESVPTLMDLISGLSRTRTLFAKAEVIRFLNEKGQTEYNIVYKIPNNELQFLPQTGGYVADLDIALNIHINERVIPIQYDYRA